MKTLNGGEAIVLGELISMFVVWCSLTATSLSLVGLKRNTTHQTSSVLSGNVLRTRYCIQGSAPHTYVPLLQSNDWAFCIANEIEGETIPYESFQCSYRASFLQPGF